MDTEEKKEMPLHVAFLQSEALYTMMHDLTLPRDGILPFLCASVARFRHQFAILFWGDDETVGVGMDEFDIKDVSVSKDPLVKAFALARHLDEEIKGSVCVTH